MQSLNFPAGVIFCITPLILARDTQLCWHDIFFFLWLNIFTPSIILSCLIHAFVTNLFWLLPVHPHQCFTMKILMLYIYISTVLLLILFHLLSCLQSVCKIIITHPLLSAQCNRETLGVHNGKKYMPVS